MPCHRCGAPQKRRRKHQRPQRRPSSLSSSDEGPRPIFYRRKKEFMSLDGEHAMGEPNGHDLANSSAVANPAPGTETPLKQSGIQGSAGTDEPMSGFETSATVRKNKVKEPQDLFWLYHPMNYTGDSNSGPPMNMSKDGAKEASLPRASRLSSQGLHGDSGGSGAQHRFKLRRPRTVDRADYLTERGANPRTGMISPSIASANLSDCQSRSSESLPSTATKWRQNGDQWISMESNRKTPSPPPNSNAPKRDGFSKSKPLPVDPPVSRSSSQIPQQPGRDYSFLGETGADIRKQIPRNMLVLMRHVCHSPPKSAHQTNINPFLPMK